jgi:hypothetical protein
MEGFEIPAHPTAVPNTRDDRMGQQALNLFIGWQNQPSGGFCEAGFFSAFKQNKTIFL